MLSELGLVGLGLYVAAIALLVAAAVGNPFSRRRDPLHPVLVAMQAGVIAFFVHLSWDWDWDMAAVGTLVFVFARRVRLVSGDPRRGTSGARTGRRLRPVIRRPRASVLLRRPPAASGEAAGPAATPAWLRADEKERMDESGREDGRASARRARRSRRVGWAPRVVASAALVLLAVSWMPPYLAHRAESAAIAASSDGDVVAALATREGRPASIRWPSVPC